MTNFRMSLRLSVALVLALAFCCLALSGVVMAKEAKVQTAPGDDGSMTSRSPELIVTGKAVIAPSANDPFAGNRRPQLSKLEMMLTNKLPDYVKEPVSGRVNVVRFARVQGDAIADPFVITALPYNVTAATDGFVDDYDEACDYTSTSPDVVYSYAAGADMTVVVDLCASLYDTKVFVYENDEYTPVACNDDACGDDDYKSSLIVSMTAGNTYYIVVDGYGGDFGTYTLDVTEYSTIDPCGVTIPAGAVDDGDACGTDPDPNGGCNNVTPAFGYINCGDILSGTLWMDGGTRDMDWYWHTFDADTTATFTGSADIDFVLFILENPGGDCSAVAIVDAVAFTACTMGSVTADLLAGDYIFVMAGGDFYDAPCADGPYNHWCELAGVPYTPPVGPPNDECAGAIAIGDETININTTEATTSGIGTHSIGQDVWYCYTAPLTGEATFSLCGSDFDTKIAVWDGCGCPPTTELAYNDDDCYKALQSSVTVPIVSGNTYLVQVGGYSAGVGNIELVTTSNTVGPVDPGTNCANPLVINFTGTFNDVNTTCGFDDDYNATEFGDYDGGEDIIYELVIPTDMCVDVVLDPLGTTYTAIGIFSACPTGTGFLVDGISNSGSAVYGLDGVFLAAGTYYVMLDTWPSPDCIPSFDLTITEVTCPVGPANDHCDAPIEIFDGYNGVFSNAGADTDGDPDVLCDSYGDLDVQTDVWFKYTATCGPDGTVLFDLCDSPLDTKFAVYYAPGFDCSTMSILACNDDACGVSGYQSAISISGVWPGAEFIVRVGAYGGGEGDFVINVSCDVIPVPGNDNCADLETWYGGPIPTLTEGSPLNFTGTVAGATAGDCAMLGPNVWEAFTIDTCMNIEINYCGTVPSNGTFYIVMESACPCNGDQSTLVWYETTSWTDCGDDNPTVTFVEVPAGTYYYPVIYDAAAANGPYNINVIGEICPPYCGASASSAYEYISRVEFNTINNSSGADDYFDYYEDGPNQLATTLYKGVDGYDLTVESTNGYSSDQVSAFIDWNIDYVFDPLTESIAIVGNPGYGPFTGVVDCPITAVAGASCLRVRLNDGAPADPCGTTSWGEVEDYRIDIMDLPCGDVNVDAAIDMVDVNILIDYYFNDPTGAIVLLPITANGDVNGDCCVNIADIVMLAEYVADPGTAAAPICLPCTP